MSIVTDDSQGMNTGQYVQHQRLAESLRDALTGRSCEILTFWNTPVIIQLAKDGA